ncbi:MAG TPA: glycosyltransferase family 39 protein [Caldimonas sp.]|nr:glycosyltransferase family 39 protein [Caldimonas sp.]
MAWMNELPRLFRRVPPVAAVIGAFTLLRLVLAATSPLLPQEAYYWTWSRYPDLSYFDHPPLASYAIGMTTALFGNTVFGVKSAAVLWSLGWNVLWARLVLDTYGDERLAAWSLLALNLTLIYEALGFGPTPDGPLLFAWVGAIWAISRVAATGRRRWWLIAGVFTGLACLGKYAGVLIPVITLVYLLAAAAQRRWLRRPEPYLALLLAAAIFSPVIVWNVQHHGASFAFQSTRRLSEMTGLKPRFFLVLVATQCLVVTPWLFFVSLAAAWRGVRDLVARRIDERDLLLLVSALVPIVIFTAVSFRANAKIQWLAPAWWSLIVLGVRHVLARPEALRRFELGLASSAAVLGVGIVVALVPDLPLPGDFNSWSGWSEAAARVDREQAALRAVGVDSFVFGPNYKVSSLIWFHRARDERTYAQDILGQKALQFDYFPAGRKLQGATGLLVVSDQAQSKLDMAEVGTHFASLERIAVLQTGAMGRTTRTIEIWRGTGYRGPRP